MLPLKKSFLISVLLVCTSALLAQDIQFSQFYAVTPYQNPAYAGGAHALRFMAHGRYQWPGLDAKYVTGLFSVDNYFHKYNSGAGIIIMQDQQGYGDIKSTTVDLQYAYDLPITKDFSIRAGLQGGFANRTLDYSKLYYPSQVDENTGVVTQGLNGPSPSKNYFDISTGALLYSSKIWGGVSLHHINTPNQSFYGDRAPLPMKTAFTAGYRIVLDGGREMAYLHTADKIVLTPTVHYKMQGKNDQFDMGAYLMYEQILAGAWYRGIPLKRYGKGLHNNESVALSLGWLYNNWSFQYSIDFIVSQLSRVGTGGSHELNLTYVHHKTNKHKPLKRLPCPDFYRSQKHH
ncbi:MAG: type IX secretion system membrane protein PorP/SprF [Cytophagaceae bacterium]|jgi:type IX secretion system PorP/SprF family membrane protein|nr:type IX secretion system membrane protein PorP/SprF [Cytophagaceae bacterium]